MNGTLTVAQPTGPYLRGSVAFVTSLYSNALGRTAEPSALRFWTRRLGAARARPQNVARQIWTMPEHIALIRQHAAPRISLAAAFGNALRAWRLAAWTKPLHPTATRNGFRFL